MLCFYSECCCFDYIYLEIQCPPVPRINNVRNKRLYETANFFNDPWILLENIIETKDSNRVPLFVSQ